MAQNVTDFLLRRLCEWAVNKVLAYPGDGISGIVAVFGTPNSQPKFIQARHEEMATFEAVGYSKFTGKVAPWLSTRPRPSSSPPMCRNWSTGPLPTTSRWRPPR